MPIPLPVFDRIYAILTVGGWIQLFYVYIPYMCDDLSHSTWMAFYLSTVLCVSVYACFGANLVK